MQIKTLADFMRETAAYFTNGFPNEIVEARFAEKLSYVKPGSLDRLFNTLTENFPATWTPDVKALKEAITESGIMMLSDPERVNKCTVCGNTWTGTGLCPECCYHAETDGTIEAHREWYKNWKAGKEPRLDMGAIMRSLEQKTRVQENQ